MKSNSNTLNVGITMGDPTGIGPEVLLKALQAKDLPAEVKITLFANPYILKDQGSFLDIPVYFSQRGERFVLHVQDKHFDIVDPTNWKDKMVFPGRPDPTLAEGILRCINMATMWALEDKIDAMVTAPVSKAIIRQGGFHNFRGHTEYLASLTGAPRGVMMLATSRLKVVLVTTHIPFRQIIEQITPELILDTISRTEEWFSRNFGVKPNLAITSLNPHAGEDGSLGDEEQSIIIPAIRAAQNNNIKIDGPIPADSAFRLAIAGEWDIVIALYHDQGMIPVKMNSNGPAVNITLGLPIVRTSVDHGTAFDIAGRGRASEDSMIMSLEYAIELAQRKRQQASL